MMEEHKPWEINPVLTPERLEYIGQLLLRVATGAFKSHEPDKGDGKWGLGCRRYERSCAELVRAAAADAAPWLTARRTNGSLEITLGVESCPIRFLSGDAEGPDQHHVLRAQEQAELWPNPDSEGWSWLFVVESDERGSPTQVIVEQANISGNIRNRWIAATNTIIATPTIVKQGKEIPTPRIGGPDEGKKKKSNDGSGNKS
jgi:hypothetical protein